MASKLTTAAVAAGAVTLASMGVGPAAATPAKAVPGDTVTYAFYSGTKTATIAYLGANGRIVQRKVNLPTFSSVEGWYFGQFEVTTRVGGTAFAYIRSNGQFAACAVRINDQSHGMVTDHGPQASTVCT